MTFFAYRVTIEHADGGFIVTAETAMGSKRYIAKTLEEAWTIQRDAFIEGYETGTSSTTSP